MRRPRRVPSSTHTHTTKQFPATSSGHVPEKRNSQATCSRFSLKVAATRPKAGPALSTLVLCTPPTSAYTPNRLKKRYEPCTSMPGALGCMRLRCASVANARGASTRPTFYGVTVWTSETPRSCRLFSTRDPTIRLRMGDQSGRTHRCTCTMTVRMRRRLLPRDLCDV